jgi:hypothetical protein
MGVVTADLLFARDDYGDLYEYLVPMAIVGIISVLAVGLIAGSLAVHSVETTLERRREMAALVANGVPASTLSAALRAECLLITLPLTLAFSVVGMVGTTFLTPSADGAYVGGVIAVAATVGFVTWSVNGAARVVRPWLRAAVDPGNLRTE